MRGAVGLVALMFLASSAIVLGLSTWLWVSLAAMFGLGFFRLVFKINNNTLVQTTIPDGLAGPGDGDFTTWTTALRPWPA